MAAPPAGHLPARHPPPAPPADRARHARRGQGPRNRRAPLDADGETRARPPHPRHPHRLGLPPRPVTVLSDPVHIDRDTELLLRLGSARTCRWTTIRQMIDTKPAILQTG